MRRMGWVCGIAAVGVSALVVGSRVLIAQGTAPAGWELAWSDEFDAPLVDQSIWNVADGPLDTYGSELQTFQPSNVLIGGGYLSLESRIETAQERPYTSGAISTELKKTFGPADFRIEIRAKAPKGRGIWPAIWMREGTMPVPDTGVELDIMELLGQEPTRAYMTQHVWSDYTHLRRPAACEATGIDFSAGFHTFSLEKTATTIRWYIDGVQRCQSTVDFPVLPSYLMINTSVGGSWPGSPTATTVFPQTFDIDYVRVYQRSTAPVDAVVSAWGSWTATSAWSACSNGSQVRTEQRTRTVIQPALNGGATPVLIETRTSTQACVVVAPPTASIAVTQCTITATAATSPDGKTGWGVQYYRAGQALGSRDTTAPFTQSGTVNRGTYAVTATWTKSGATTITQQLGSFTCQ